MSQKPRRARSQSAKSDAFPPTTGGLPEEGTGHRQVRLEHILLHELQSLISDEATDPALDGVQVLSVHLAPDGGHARIAYAVTTPLLGREQEVARTSKLGLGRATGFLRARLAQQLHLKKLPQLTFTFVGVAQAGLVELAPPGGDPWPG